MLKHKRIEVELDQGALEIGQIEGWANNFHVLDAAGERTHEQTFVKTLAEWSERGKLPVMLYEHEATDVAGKWLTMELRDKGLWVRGEVSNEWLLNKIRKDEIYSLSIGYITREYHVEGSDVVLDDVELREVSIVSVPANIESVIVNVKSLEVKNEDETQVEEEHETQVENEEKEIETEQEQEEVKEVETEVGITDEDIRLASYLLKRRKNRR